MRLAIVSPYSWTVPSGVNSHVMSLADQLEQRGHDVWIIAPAGTLTSSAKTLPDNFILAGRSFPVRSNGSVAYGNAWPLMMQKMGRIFARHNFDIVHVHEPTIPSVGAAAAMAARVPVVGTFHAAGDACNYYERWKPLAGRILASIAVRIAVSEAARDCVAGCFPGEYRLIPNGIDVNTYAGARNGSKVPGRILFVGRPEPRKGIPTLVEAFSGLRHRLPGTSLVLAGPTFEELQALVRGFGLAGPEMFRGIEALGRVAQEVKVEEMRRAEVLCAPSLGGESFGIVLTEALAAGLPVVASDIPGYRAVLADGSAGLLVPPGDGPALENTLFSLLQDPDLRRNLSLSGFARAERYSWVRVVEQVVEVYQEAIHLGPQLVNTPAVPAFAQVRHFMQQKRSNGRKPAQAHGRAVR